MGLRRRLFDTCFAGCHDPFSRIIVRTGTTVSPNAVVTAPKGTFLVMDYNGNAVNKDVYINTDGSTAWTMIHNETA